MSPNLDLVYVAVLVNHEERLLLGVQQDAGPACHFCKPEELFGTLDLDEDPAQSWLSVHALPSFASISFNPSLPFRLPLLQLELVASELPFYLPILAPNRIASTILSRMLSRPS